MNRWTNETKLSVNVCPVIQSVFLFDGHLSQDMVQIPSVPRPSYSATETWMTNNRSSPLLSSKKNHWSPLRQMINLLSPLFQKQPITEHHYFKRLITDHRCLFTHALLCSLFLKSLLSDIYSNKTVLLTKHCPRVYFLTHHYHSFILCCFLDRNDFVIWLIS